MDYYRYRAFLEKLPWIETILEDRWFTGYSHLNVSITVVSISAEFFTSNLNVNLDLFQTDSGKREGLIIDLLDSIWVVRREPEESATLIKDVSKMKEGSESLNFLGRPMYELLARCYTDSLYFVWTFAKLVESDTDSQKSKPFIKIVILKPKKGECISDYLKEIRNKITEEVKEELDL